MTDERPDALGRSKDGMTAAEHLSRARKLLGEHRAHAAAVDARAAWAVAPEDLTLAIEVSQLLKACGEEQLAEQLFQETARIAHASIDGIPRWAPASPGPSPSIDSVRSLYLDLVERVVCNWIYMDGSIVGDREMPFDERRRATGTDIPVLAHTMIGRARLRHLRWAVETALIEGVPGDLMEAGVWRGGAIALMRAVLAAHGEATRRVWAVDSFSGVPPPDPRFPQDFDTQFHFEMREELAVDLDSVKKAVDRYGLLDDRIIFVKGNFRDTLPTIRGICLAVLRIDGDLYSSTTDVLENMYPMLSDGGIVILDDYGPVVDSRRAVTDFRLRHAISEPLYAVDGDAVFWRKGRRHRVLQGGLGESCLLLRATEDAVAMEVDSVQSSSWDSASMLAIIPHMKTRADVLKLVRPRGVGVELGVADGVFSELILRTSGLLFLYSIDMYAGDRGHDVVQYRSALKRLSPFRERSCLLRMRFDEALSLFDDESLDFVYVDGYAHTAEEGGRTFYDWYPKIRPGGIIAGHDYDLSAFPMVVEAVDRFAADVGLSVHIVPEDGSDAWSMGHPSWLAVKPTATIR